MPLVQLPLNATTTSAVVQVPDPRRHFLYIQVYTYIPPGGSVAQTGVVYVAFNQVATKGLNGELEIRPGGPDFVFGGNYEENSHPGYSGPKVVYTPNCPLGSINVIASAETIYGCVQYISFPGA